MVTMKKLAFQIMDANGDGSICPADLWIMLKSFREFDYALSEVVGRSYGVSKLPYGVLVNSEGRISSLGIVNSREHLESLFEAERMHVASIQEYLQQADEGSNADVVQQYDSTRR